VRVWSTGRDSPSASKRVGEAGSIRILRVSTGGSYVATVHLVGITHVLTMRDAASLVEVAGFGLDEFAAVSDIIVDEQSRTTTVSGSANDGLLRFFRW